MNNTIVAAVFASILLLGCQTDQGAVVQAGSTQKLEPWATPKGDARTDCAVYITKLDNWHFAYKAENKAVDQALEKYDVIEAKSGEKAADNWWESDQNPIAVPRKEKNERRQQLDFAEINILKHLGYSQERLKEMWEWRDGSVLLLENVRSRELKSSEAMKKGMPPFEANAFCDKLLGLD